MTKKIFFFASACFLGSTVFAENIVIQTPNTSLILSANPGEELKYIYYGDKLSDSDISTVTDLNNPRHSAYPVYGLSGANEAALAVKHADGNMTLDMNIIDVNTTKEGPATTTTIKMKDKVYPFYVDVNYKYFDDADVIETWTEVKHNEKSNVTLNQFSSAYMPIRRGDVWLSSLYGTWQMKVVLHRKLLCLV